MSNLIALRDENEWTLRLQAVRAIRMIGQFDEVAMEVLTALSNDANQFVAREAREALRTATRSHGNLSVSAATEDTGSRKNAKWRRGVFDRK